MAVEGRSFMEKGTKRLLFLAILFLLLQAAVKSCGASVSGSAEEKDSLGRYLLRSVAGGAEAVLYDQFMPGIALTADGNRGTHWLLQGQIDCLIPFYGFLMSGMAPEESDSEGFRSIMLAEAEESGFWPEDGEYSEERAPFGNGALSGNGMLSGNDALSGNGMLSENDALSGNNALSGNGMQDIKLQGEELAELLRAENEAALQARQSTVFLPHTRQTMVELEPLEDYETLIKQFYTIDANTVAGSDQLSVKRFTEADMSISKEGEGPQILIYHTHSQEAFADSVPGDPSDTIQGVGEYLASLLRDSYGYNVLHHTGQYDLDSRDDSYSKALTDLEQVLKDNPSIQVVIDLHRDAVPESTRLVMDLDGRPTARFMFFNGLSRTKKTGNIAYLYNENLDSNLAFSFQMQRKAMEYYPGLTRKIYLKGYRYNLHLRPRSLLIELGAQNNTVEEAMNACEPLAHILDMVLSGEKE